MNAFHPEFIKTHYPDLLNDHKFSSKVSLGMSKFVEAKRANKSNYGQVKEKINDLLLPKKFAIYNGAGMPK